MGVKEIEQFPFLNTVSAFVLIAEVQRITQSYGVSTDVQRMKVRHLMNLGLNLNEARFFLGYFLNEPDESGVLHKELFKE